MNLRIEYLADHPQAVPLVRRWFETQWADYYGPGGPGNAEQDLLRYSSREALPIGVVGLLDARVCGIAALRRDSIDTHRHLSPWVAALMVSPEFRCRGIGTSLVRAAAQIARELGFPAVYCATSTANGLLEREGWSLLGRASFEVQAGSIYSKAL